MNGVHDMGGMQCFGPVIPEEDEPIFHGEWEKKALAITVAMGFCGNWNLDISRFARESLPPDFYLSSSYYQIWIAGLEQLMLKRDMVSQEELQSGKLIESPIAVKRVVSAQEMPAALAKGGPVDREPFREQAFAVGDQVKTLNMNPSGHTRLPGYAREKSGVVAGIQGFHVYPDANAKEEDDAAHWLYSIAFSSEELFGSNAEPGGEVMIDCWEPYLEQA